jgi:hypothetical protein
MEHHYAASVVIETLNRRNGSSRIVPVVEFWRIDGSTLFSVAHRSDLVLFRLADETVETFLVRLARVCELLTDKGD